MTRKLLWALLLTLLIIPTFAFGETTSMRDMDRQWEWAAGEHTRYVPMGIFGRNPDVDTGTDPEDVWNYGGVETWLAAAQPMSISSSAAADMGLDVTINYIDTNWDAKTVTVALDAADGRTETSTGVSMLRVNYVSNGSGTAFAGNVYVYESSDTVTAGVPDTASLVHGKIDIGRDFSQMGKFSVPRHHDAYIVEMWASINNDKGWARMAVYQRSLGGVFMVRPEIGLDEVQMKYLNEKPVVWWKIPAQSDVKWVCMEVEADNTDVSGGFEIILENWKGF